MFLFCKDIEIFKHLQQDQHFLMALGRTYKHAQRIRLATVAIDLMACIKIISRSYLCTSLDLKYCALFLSSLTRRRKQHFWVPKKTTGIISVTVWPKSKEQTMEFVLLNLLQR